jgi:hypothetical protein
MLAGHNDPNVDKHPPRAATKVSFPDIRPLMSVQTKPWTEADHPELDKILSQSSAVTRGKATEKLIWTALNINFKPGVTLQQLIDSSAAKDFFPPFNWMSPPIGEAQEKEIPAKAVAEGDVPRLHNMKALPNRESFYSRVHDLMYSNEEAYHGLRRATEDGKPAPRITHGRLFFIALDEMGQYWDSSQDQYIRKPKNGKDKGPLVFTKEPNGSGGKYRGYRIGNGQAMPSGLRLNTVKALVELAMYPFAFIMPAFESKETNNPNKYVEIKTLRISIPELTRRIWRIPALTDKARLGIGEGPVLGISCRDGFMFSSGHWDGPKDLMKETSALFILALERARHGKKETWPGEGKAWSTRIRFAGYPYTVPGEYLLDDDEQEILDGLNDNERCGVKGATKKKREYEQYLRSIMTLKQRGINRYKYSTIPVPSLWEKMAEYSPIGKDKDSKYDDVFLVSAINHHVSILKLHVHEAYLVYLKDGKFPDNAASLPTNWSEPVIERSLWYDLFDIEDRVQVFRALWAIAGYMARPGI